MIRRACQAGPQPARMVKKGAKLGRRRAILSLLLLVLLALSVGDASCFSVDSEIELGEKASQEVEQEMPLSENEKWQQDVDALGQQFVPFITRKEIPYHFRIVEAEDKINAFALPGGYIYFTERMWRIMTPDERAAIMAHEITHCDQRHGVDQMLKARQRALWTLPLVILTGGTGLGYAVLLGDTLIQQRYSRKHEREADELGIKLLNDAGFNPGGMVTVMKKLLHIESAYNLYEVSDIFASHPDTQKRIDYLTQVAVAMGATESSLQLKSVDDPARLGNITTRIRDMNVLSARTSTPLRYRQKVLIKKMLWDDETQALAPKTVAVATVLTPGSFPTLILANKEGSGLVEIMPGDGIFPAPPGTGEEAPAASATTPK